MGDYRAGLSQLGKGDIAHHVAQLKPGSDLLFGAGEAVAAVEVIHVVFFPGFIDTKFVGVSGCYSVTNVSQSGIGSDGCIEIGCGGKTVFAQHMRKSIGVNGNGTLHAFVSAGVALFAGRKRYKEQHGSKQN